MNNIYKAASLSITSLFVLAQFGCSTPTTNTPSNTPASPGTTTTTTTDASTNNTTKEEVLKLDRFTLQITDQSGAKNPISPEDIDYIDLNNTKINAKDIVIAKTNDDLKKGNVFFKGSGEYLYSPVSGNKDILKVKLKNSESVLTIPILKQGFSIKAGYFNRIQGTDTIILIKRDASGNASYVSLLNIGTPEFQCSIDLTTNKITVSYGNDNSKSFTLDQFVSEDNPKGTEATEEAKKQVEEIKNDVDNKKNPFDPFVGVWKLNFPGLNFLNTIRKTGNNGFITTSIINDKTFSASSTYDNTKETLEMVDVNSTFQNEKLSAKINLVGDNNLTITIVSTDNLALKGFVGTPFPLVRKVD